MTELEVALSAEAKLLGGLQGPEAIAFAIKEHGQFEGNLIAGKNGQGASGANKLLELRVKRSHAKSPRKRGKKGEKATRVRIPWEAE